MKVISFIVHIFCAHHPIKPISFCLCCGKYHLSTPEVYLQMFPSQNENGFASDRAKTLNSNALWMIEFEYPNRGGKNIYIYIYILLLSNPFIFIFMSSFVYTIHNNLLYHTYIINCWLIMLYMYLVDLWQHVCSTYSCLLPYSIRYSILQHAVSVQTCSNRKVPMWSTHILITCSRGQHRTLLSYYQHCWQQHTATRITLNIDEVYHASWWHKDASSCQEYCKQQQQ